MIYIVGIGPGHKDYILSKAIETLKGVDKIIGYSRAIEAVDFIDTPSEKVESLKTIIEVLDKAKGDIALVASGDPNFFGIAEYIGKNLEKPIEVIPGISSFQYLTAKLNLSWSTAYTGSMHAREDSFIEKVLENKRSIWLCDKINSPKELCKRLVKEEIESEVIVGWKLSYSDEIIERGNPKKFLNSTFNDLSIFIVERI